MIVVDVKKEINAILEAKKIGLPIIGVVDTNGNPELVDYPIPANDDGFKSIQLILEKLSEAVLEGSAESEALLKKNINEGENNVNDSRKD